MMVSAMEAQRHEMQALLEQEREQNTKLREQALLREQVQIAALQSRVQALHTAQLLTDAELYAVEDIVGDGGDQVAALLELSVRMVGDAAFSRQLRRKHA